MDINAFLFGLVRILLYALIVGGWVLVISLIINAYKKRRRRFWLVQQKYVTLLVQVPRNNEKGPLSSQFMFASLHGIYKSARERLNDGSFQEHISFEVVSVAKYIRFYVRVPEHLRDFVEGQMYSQYPNVEIKEIDDYALAKRPDGLHFAGTELNLIRNDIYPIKTFQNFEVDPLAGITGVLAQVEENEQIWVQILARPVDDSWQKRAISYVNDLKSGKVKSGGGGKGVLGFLSFILGIFKLLSTPPDASGGAKPVKLAGPVEQAAKAIEEKSTKLGYEVKIRVVFLSPASPEAMKLKVQSIVGAFKQYNASNLNGFTYSKVHLDDYEFLNEVQARNFERPGFILNIEEIASLYHLPTVSVETPSIVWAGSKKGEPPAALPIEGVVPAEELTVFGQTNFRGETINFGIKSKDRNQHMYIIGQTGTGKSTVMKIQALDDIKEGRGLAIIDPHGEFIDTILDYIPEDRIKDVVILNPGDREFCPGFNLLENVDENKRDLVASSLMSIFTKIWEGVWSARMEHILKNTILALLETPGTTLLSASKMLVNKDYRDMIIGNVKDPTVREFWLEEFEAQAKSSPKFLVEAIAPIQNKIGQFLSVPSIRNMVGQPHSTIDFKEITDGGKILLVKLSKGEIGEDNMRLLGAMIITKIYLTIMERAGRKESEMKSFYLYVDEFQNFATSSFANILSESRKYKLNLIIAHQYIAQLTPEIRDAVLGNAGNIITFRVGPDDPPTLKKTFEPVFDENDMVNLSTFHIYVKMMIDNTVYPAFSATTIKYWEYFKEKYGFGQQIVDDSRRRNAIPRADVEKAILTWNEQMSQLDSSKSSKKGEGDEKRAGEGLKEFKDKDGGIWYLRKTQSAKLKAQSEDNANAGQGSEGAVFAEPLETQVAEETPVAMPPVVDLAPSVPAPVQDEPKEPVVVAPVAQQSAPEQGSAKDEAVIEPGGTIEL